MSSVCVLQWVTIEVADLEWPLTHLVETGLLQDQPLWDFQWVTIEGLFLNGPTRLHVVFRWAKSAFTQLLIPRNPAWLCLHSWSHYSTLLGCSWWSCDSSTITFSHKKRNPSDFYSNTSQTVHEHTNHRRTSTPFNAFGKAWILQTQFSSTLWRMITRSPAGYMTWRHVSHVSNSRDGRGDFQRAHIGSILLIVRSIPLGMHLTQILLADVNNYPSMRTYALEQPQPSAMQHAHGETYQRHRWVPIDVPAARDEKPWRTVAHTRTNSCCRKFGSITPQNVIPLLLHQMSYA